MASNEETNAAGTDTRPPMLVESDYDSWKIRIHSQGLPWTHLQQPHHTSTAKGRLGYVEIAHARISRIFSTRRMDCLDESMNAFVLLETISIMTTLGAYWGMYVTNVKRTLDISTPHLMLQIYTHLKAYEPHAKKTLNNRAVTSIVDPLAIVAHTTSAPIAILLVVSKAVSHPPTTSSGLPPTQDYATVHDGHIVTEPVQRKAPGNVGNTGARGKKVICYNCRGEGHVARQCKEPKRKMDSQYFKDKALLMEAKEKGDVLDAEAEAFLADWMKLPNAAVAFMANLSSTSATNNPVNEVHSNDNQIFDNVDYQIQEMHQEEHLDSDAETEIDDNTIPYHQYLLDTEAQQCSNENDLSGGSGVLASANGEIVVKLVNQHTWNLELINIMKVLNVRYHCGSCRPKQAIRNAEIQLKDTITSLRIQLDGLKVENVSLKKRFDELSKANTHSRTAYTENTKLKAQVTGTTSSGRPPLRTQSACSRECTNLVPKGSLNMTGDRARLINFVEKFIGTVRFGNDEYAAIIGYGDYKLAFMSHPQLRYGGSTQRFTDNQSVLHLTADMMSASPVCLLTKASSTKSWLWHRRLNHLNFGTLNELARKNLVRGLPMLKYDKDHLPLRTNENESINGKKYVLVIVDDYTRFGWVRFLRSKDETPQVIEKFIVKTQRALNATVRFVRTDNGRVCE
ncbi:retrovirus-related pol polyprotein from transposon TNT 1-94 [Tanacetum coccineum]